MRWRRVPPVYSPVQPAALLGALAPRPVERSGESNAVRATLARDFDAREVILTDSGTSALTLAIELAAPRGSTIAVPGYACLDIIAAAARAGARVVLYDLEPATLSPDVDSLARALAQGAAAAVIATLFGYPVDMPRIASLLAEHGVTLIEDAAQAAGATLGGRRVGSFGALSVLSFGRGKGTTAGGGGALLVHEPTLVERARDRRRSLTRGAGRTRAAATLAAQWVLARPMLYSLPASVPALALGEMLYRPAPPPAAMAPFTTRLLASALSREADELRVRRAHARTLDDAGRLGSVLAPIEAVEGAEPGYLRFAGLTRGNGDGAPHLGVVRPYPQTLAEHHVTWELLACPSALPGACELRDRLVTLPTHSRVGETELALLTSWLAGTSSE